MNGDHDDRPLVSATLAAVFARVESAVRWCLQSVDPRVVMGACGAAALAIFLLVLVRSVLDEPGLAGIVRGVFGGFFVALLFAGAGAWLLLWGRSRSPRTPDTAATAGATALESMLAPTLAELNAVRADVIKAVRVRSQSRVPLAIAAAIAFWVLAQWSDDPPDVLTLIAFTVVGALAGEVWAIGKLDREYRTLYKDRVLPHLAARFGDLSYRRPTLDVVHKLRAQRIFAEFEEAQADDAIVGTHRGLALSIAEVRLQRGSGDDRVVVFDGLLVDLTLPRALTGTTAIVSDAGMFGNLKARWRSDGLAPVRLEDAQFEGAYEVYSTDQIEARALLTPAFMQRFSALAAQSGSALPGAIAEGSRLMVAVPKRTGAGDLFEPPAYWKRAGGETLLKLEQDIRAVLGMADAVIELDFWAAGSFR